MGQTCALTTLVLWAGLMHHRKAHFPGRNTLLVMTARVRVTWILIRATSKFEICILKSSTPVK
jgi:hypothetical protein